MPTPRTDERHHVRSLLMRESLVDKDLLASTEKEREPVRMLPFAHMMKIGASSIVDKGRAVVYPLIDALGEALQKHRLILGTGGGARTRHVFSIGIDLGLPTGILAQLAMADANGNAHILGTLLAPHGVVAIPPEMFGHLLPLFLRASPGVIFHGEPPYSLWEHPPGVGRIPPHRTDVGCYLVGECFGCASVTLVKDVDGLYDRDPKSAPGATLIREIGTSELRKHRPRTLPFDEALIDLLPRGRLMRRFQIVNGTKPELVLAALEGEHVGTIVHAD